MRPTQKELADAQLVFRKIQLQIKYPAELVERAIRTIVRDELEQQAQQTNRGPNS